MLNHKTYISTKYTLCEILDKLSKARCADDYCRLDDDYIIKHYQKQIKTLKNLIKEYELKEIQKSFN